jgi:pyruvate dehydrogenase E2 component (dihydrolipoamide acetyltransferase)
VSLRSGGLIAPVMRGVAEKSLGAVMSELRDLVSRARRGALRSSELDGASMTVTNLGDRGAEVVDGVIHPPQVALVGVGRILDRALVVDGEVVARPSVVLSLAADHRASDGQAGSRLLAGIDRALQAPADL